MNKTIKQVRATTRIWGLHGVEDVVISEKQYDIYGRLIYEKNTQDPFFYYSYEEFDPNQHDYDNDIEEEASYKYDELGHLIAKQQRKDDVTVNEYYSYDADGRETSYTRETSTGALYKFLYRYFVDEYGREWKIVKMKDNDETESILKVINKNGLVLFDTELIFEEDGSVSFDEHQYVYDENNRLVDDYSVYASVDSCDWGKHKHITYSEVNNQSIQKIIEREIVIPDAFFNNIEDLLNDPGLWTKKEENNELGDDIILEEQTITEWSDRTTTNKEIKNDTSGEKTHILEMRDSDGTPFFSSVVIINSDDSYHSRVISLLDKKGNIVDEKYYLGHDDLFKHIVNFFSEDGRLLFQSITQKKIRIIDNNDQRISYEYTFFDE